jgi:uncharacterized membrane protein YccC
VLQHVALETSCQEARAATAFWRLLGFEEVDPPESLRDRAGWLQRGATQIHLLWSDEPVAPPEGHAAVVVEDYDTTLERLRKAGHEVEVMSAPPPS